MHGTNFLLRLCISHGSFSHFNGSGLHFLAGLSQKVFFCQFFLCCFAFYFPVFFFRLFFLPWSFLLSSSLQLLVSLPLSILTFSVFGRLAATCSALILPLVLFCVWCCCCFCLSRVLVFDFLCPLVGRSAGQPVNRAFRRSTGQPPRSAGQPGNRATGEGRGQPGSGQPVARSGRPVTAILKSY